MNRGSNFPASKTVEVSDQVKFLRFTPTKQLQYGQWTTHQFHQFRHCIYLYVHFEEDFLNRSIVFNFMTKFSTKITGLRKRLQDVFCRSQCW